ncbi:MAG: 1-acyl-sn-glycerol-3-phosphate acyltransferase [Bacilli bacterium]|nr:1-acyl-sn-glycerol-3-phosphate acyltransferase [Bacilli bacterium]
MNIKESFYSLLVRLFYNTRFKFELHYNDFDRKRKDPYILIGNHPCLHDGVYTSMYLRKPPMPIINAFMFTSKVWKFILTKVYKSIPKRKGQSDIITVKSMMNVLQDGRGIMLFPEGNSSFFGEQSEIQYSTVKFLKKMKKDVVIIKTNGAYMTAPRWCKKPTFRGLFELNFYTLFKGEELEHLSLDEINEGVTNAIKFNDFDWNRERRYKYNPKKRALGLERFIYLCPKCGSHNTITTHGNTISCTNCGELAHFNKYSLLEGLEFDNLVEWGKLQHEALPRIAKENLYTNGTMFDVDIENYEQVKIGYVDLELVDRVLYVQHRLKEYSFDLDTIKGLTLTRKDEVSFDYEDKTYFFKLQNPMLFYDVIKYKIGG